ncbi:MAG: toprim domain-containing protein [Oscillospiraceae bacterium]|nr:toprim domain-containing protein [Oscillospiraceae bacterium]
MNLELLKLKLPEYLEKISVKEKNGMYHCPLCGSGTHRGPKSDGALSVYNNGKNWRCFSCDQGGDIFTLIEKVQHINGFPQQLAFASEMFGIPVSQDSPSGEARPAPKMDSHSYQAYIASCIANVQKTDYWTKQRGFSPDIVRRFRLGYDPRKQMVVIPYDAQDSYYLTRSVSDKRFRKPAAGEAGEEPIYNREALYQPEHPCFVCESPIDAISIMAASGFPAIALGGTGSRKLLNQIAQKKPLCPLILSFDCDDAGRAAAEKTAAELKGQGIAFVTAQYDTSVFPQHMQKDANDFYRGNLPEFAEQLQQNAEAVQRVMHAEENLERREHEAFSGANRLDAFLNGIHSEHGQEAIPTGFEDLDAQLDGGLFPGLYILGAVSSLGKTTFLLQMADQIAQQGRDVLYFSLEMSANELIAKSISRQTYLLCGLDIRNAKTVRGITTKSRYANYSQTETMLINTAVRAYQDYSRHLYYYEGIGDIGAEKIKEITDAHIRLTGNLPVVMIDYLQILAPYDLRASDKQNTDKAVLELKRMSRDFDIPVFAISSLNRESYSSGEIEMSAFKESGAIEYGSDLLIGLQVQGIGGKLNAQENLKKIQDCKMHPVRNVELKILKNRNGKTGGRIGLRYQSPFNCFEKDDTYTARSIANGIDDFEPAP